MSPVLSLFLCGMLLLSSGGEVRAAEPVPEPVRVAVVDTGIAAGHPLLAQAQVEAGTNYAIPHFDTTDRAGHGTRVASLLHAAAPEAVLVPLVWYDQYPSGVPMNGGSEAIAQAVREAVDVYHCDLINVSAGITEDHSALREAVAYAEEQGVLVISALGNDYETEPGQIYYPAAYDTVAGVGALGPDGEIAPFSQRGEEALIWAPGVDLETASLRGGTETVSGCSYAAAQVTGLCAQLLAAEPDLTPAQLRERLSATAAAA